MQRTQIPNMQTGQNSLSWSSGRRARVDATPSTNHPDRKEDCGVASVSALRPCGSCSSCVATPMLGYSDRCQSSEKCKGRLKSTKFGIIDRIVHQMFMGHGNKSGPKSRERRPSKKELHPSIFTDERHSSRQVFTDSRCGEKQFKISRADRQESRMPECEVGSTCWVHPGISWTTEGGSAITQIRHTYQQSCEIRGDDQILWRGNPRKFVNGIKEGTQELIQSWLSFCVFFLSGAPATTPVRRGLGRLTLRGRSSGRDRGALGFSFRHVPLSRFFFPGPQR